MPANHLEASLRLKPGGAVLDLHGEISGFAQEAPYSRTSWKRKFSEVVRYALITPTQQEIHPLWGRCSPSRAATLPSLTDGARRCRYGGDARIQGPTTPREGGDYQWRMTQFGNYYVRFESIPAGFDDAEFLKGLPDDACQCEHWGYLFKGSLKFRYTDGHEEVVSAGEAYYARPGHSFETLEDCETVEFSPKEAFDRLMEVVGKNVEAMGQQIEAEGQP